MTSDTSGIGHSSSNTDSMRYLIGGDEQAAGPHFVDKQTATPKVKLAAVSHHKTKVKKLSSQPMVAAVKAQKKKAAKSIRLGNFQKMLTVCLRKSPELILEDGEFPKIVKKGTEEIIQAIHKAADPVLLKQHLEQFSRCEEMLLKLNSRFIQLMNQPHRKDTAKRSEILQRQRQIETVLKKFKEAKALVKVEEVAVEEVVIPKEKSKPTELPAPLIGLVGAFLEKSEGEEVLDELVTQFSHGTGKKVAEKQMQKYESVAEAVTRDVTSTIQTALLKQGEAFVFPKELKEKIKDVASLDLAGCPISPKILQEIRKNWPHIRELKFLRQPLSDELIKELGQFQNLRHLSLSECSLNDSILRKLADSTHLLSLNLTEADNQQFSDFSALSLFTELQELTLKCGISDLTPLASCPHLRSLTLFNCYNIISLKTLAGSQLEELNLQDCEQLTDLQVITTFRQLHTLILNDCTAIKDLRPLASCLTLRNLHLTDCSNIADLKPLATCLALRTLYLSGCKKIADLSPLATCLALRNLHLFDCREVRDLSPLSTLAELRELQLVLCAKVSNFDVLSQFPNLEILGLSDLPNLCNLQPLSTCLKLSKLEIYRCLNVTDLGPLSTCTRLQLFRAYGCPEISDFKALSCASNLHTVSVNGCVALASLTPLSKCKKLQHLTIDNCPMVTDVQPLSLCKNLQHLWIRNCGNIVHLHSLLVCSNMKDMSIYKCDEISDLQLFSHFTELRNLYLAGFTKVSSLQPLTSCTQLERLGLSSCPLVTPEEEATLKQALPELKIGHW